MRHEAPYPYLAVEKPVHVYRLVVKLPPGSEEPGWAPEEWSDICDRLGWCDEYRDPPRFSWPTRRTFLSRAAAERRAGFLREYGAEVAVVRSYAVIWRDPDAEEDDG